MSKENLSIAGEIGCLNKTRHRFSLVSTAGYHSDAWRLTQVKLGQRHTTLDYIVKRHLRPCPLNEVRILNRHYKELKRRLGDMVPNATFVATKIDGISNCLVLAEPITPWFNLANPINEEEAVPLLRKLVNAQNDLERFIQAADHWYDSGDMRVIDLWGLDNLVMDTNRHIRYMDSFWVFFHADIMHSLAEPDPMVTERIEVSQRRLDYLKYILAESRRG